MKFYYFAIISIGIMLTLMVAGIDGVGTNTRALIMGDNNTINQPETQYGENVSDDSSRVFEDLTSNDSSLWDKILIALIAMAVLGALNGVQLFGSFSLDGSRVIKAGLAYFIFGFFVSDMWSLVTLLFSYPDSTYIAWFVGVLMFVYTLGFAIACIEFVGGSD